MASHHVVLRARSTPLGLMWRAVCTSSGCTWMGDVRVQPATPEAAAALDTIWTNPDQAYRLACEDRDMHLAVPDLVIDWTIAEAWLHNR